MFEWLRKWIIGIGIKKPLEWLIIICNGRKRYLAVLAFVVTQLDHIFSQANLASAHSYTQVVLDTLSQSVATPTAADYGWLGLVLIALFDILRKWVIDDTTKAKKEPS